MGSPPSPGPEDYFAPGDWNIYCSICGSKLKFSKAVQNWQGMWRHVWCNEPRHPQDFVHAINTQEMAIPVSQKMGEAYELICTFNGLSCMPGGAMPGCSIPGRNVITPPFP